VCVCVCVRTGAGVGRGCVERRSPGSVVPDLPAAGGKQNTAQQPVRQRVSDDRRGHTETGR